MEGSWANAPGGIVCGRAATPLAGWMDCTTRTGVGVGGIGVGEGVGSGVGVGGGGSVPQAANDHIVRVTTISSSEKVDRLRALVTCCHHSESHPRKSHPQQSQPLYFAAQIVRELGVP